MIAAGGWRAMRSCHDDDRSAIPPFLKARSLCQPDARRGSPRRQGSNADTSEVFGFCDFTLIPIRDPTWISRCRCISDVANAAKPEMAGKSKRARSPLPGRAQMIISGSNLFGRSERPFSACLARCPASREGRLTEPVTGTRLGRRELVLLPRFSHSSGGQ